jgi:hypothetical protein
MFPLARKSEKSEFFFFNFKKIRDLTLAVGVLHKCKESKYFLRFFKKFPNYQKIFSFGQKI